MIRVIIERHAREREKLAALLRELRAAAVHQPGYISGETLVSVDDSTEITVISSWQNLSDWEKWQTSPVRAKVYKKIDSLIIGKPTVKAYQIMATEGNV